MRRLELFSWAARLLGWRAPSPRPGGARRRGWSPEVDALEPLQLLSTLPFAMPFGRLASFPIPAQFGSLTPTPTPTPTPTATATATHAATTRTQTVTVPTTLTNFSTPFAPPVALFDPALGTLTEVDVSSSVTLGSQIRSQNTSVTSPTVITATVNGSYTIDGFPAAVGGTVNVSDSKPVTVFPGGPITFTGPSTAVFPNLAGTDTKQLTLTDPASLAFFTASAGHTTISPTLTAQADANASAPNGNLRTEVVTSGSGAVTVVYHYIPNCPTITKVVRYGIHYQPTQLAVTFNQPVSPAVAQDVNNYRVVTHTGRVVGVVSAVYDAGTNTVLLTTATQVNLHYYATLVATFPGCPPTTAVFGGKASLGGYLNGLGWFVSYPGFGPLPTL